MEKKVQIFVFMLNYRSFVLLVFIVTEASLVSHDEYGDVHFIFAGMCMWGRPHSCPSPRSFLPNTLLAQSRMRLFRLNLFKKSPYIYYVFPIYNNKLHNICSSFNLVHSPFNMMNLLYKLELLSFNNKIEWEAYKKYQRGWDFMTVLQHQKIYNCNTGHSF